MTEKKIKFRDPVVEKLVDKFVSRSNVGFKKYGVTLRDDKSGMLTWINHAQEEAMDFLLYLERLKEEFMPPEDSNINEIEVHGEETL